MSKRDYDEKDLGKRDERDEKDRDKQEEKSAEEKWERDRLGAITWAAILIWAGVVLLAGNLGAFELIGEFIERIPFGLVNFPFEGAPFQLEGWTVFWLGTAAILTLQVVIRLLVPEYRRPITGTLILIVIFIGLGLGRWQCIWPLVLIAIGVGILFRSFSQKNKQE